MRLVSNKLLYSSRNNLDPKCTWWLQSANHSIQYSRCKQRTQISFLGTLYLKFELKSYLDLPSQTLAKMFKLDYLLKNSKLFCSILLVHKSLKFHRSQQALVLPCGHHSKDILNQLWNLRCFNLSPFLPSSSSRYFFPGSTKHSLNHPHVILSQSANRSSRDFRCKPHIRISSIVCHFRFLGVTNFDFIQQGDESFQFSWIRLHRLMERICWKIPYFKIQ